MTVIKFRSAGDGKYIKSITVATRFQDVFEKLNDPKVRWIAFDETLAIPKVRIVEIAEVHVR